MYSGDISEATIRRLPIYYRNICSMEAEGFEKITSAKLAERAGNSGVQVRQDFFSCGGAPKYDVPELKRWLEEKLGLDKKYKAVLVGAGNLGRAIVNCEEYHSERFFITAAFDSNLMLDGMEINDIPIMNINLFEKYLEDNSVDVVIIATPPKPAEEIFEKTVAAKIHGVWNFAPVDLRSCGNTKVQNVHLSDSLMTLSFRMNESAFF